MVVRKIRETSARSDTMALPEYEEKSWRVFERVLG